MSEIIQALGVENSPAIANELNTYFQAMQDEIQYYGGVVHMVDLYDTGDKLMVVFGAPVAHERDVQRAALTALAMQRAMSSLSSPLATRLLSQRIGIHTGFVFAGNVGSTRCNRREYTVMGDTVNLAARLMSKAPVGQIWISQDVFDQIHHDFETQALPPVELKGITGKVPVFSLQFSRLSVESLSLQGWSSTGLVGRVNELAVLRSLVENMLQGIGIQAIMDTEIRTVGAPITLGTIPGVVAHVGCSNFPDIRDIAEMVDEFAKRKYIVVVSGCTAMAAGMWKDAIARPYTKNIPLLLTWDV